MSRWLSKEDVFRLTGRRRFTAQRARLKQLQVPFVEAASGEPLVAADAVDGKGAKARNTGPRWDRLQPS